MKRKILLGISIFLMPLAAEAFSKKNTEHTFQASAERFLAVLWKIKTHYLSRENSLLADYNPWEFQFVILDRDRPSSFVGINLECPHDWACEKEPSHLSGLSIVRGKAPDFFDLPIGLNFSFVFRQQGGGYTEKNIEQLFEANKNAKSIFLFALPFLVPSVGDVGFSKKFRDHPASTSWIVLHEAFHVNVQFLSLIDPTYTKWKADPTPTDAESSVFCYDAKIPSVRKELKAAKRVWQSLAQTEPAHTLREKLKVWASAREKRYQAIPRVHPIPSRPATDCRQLDDHMERLEGTADFTAIKALVDSGELSLGIPLWYYSNLYLNDPSKIFTDTTPFYVTGSMQSFALEKLSLDNEWKKEVAMNPQASLFELVKALQK